MEWSSAWKSSKKPRKQKKYVRKAPKHVQGKQLSCHLSADLRKKYSKRSMRVRKGDKIKVMNGTFKGKAGKVEQVNAKNQRVYVTGIELLKKDGSKTLYPVKASNIMIQELDLSDKRRIKKTK